MKCPNCNIKLMYDVIMKKGYFACRKCGNFWNTDLR